MPKCKKPKNQSKSTKKEMPLPSGFGQGIPMMDIMPPMKKVGKVSKKK